MTDDARRRAVLAEPGVLAAELAAGARVVLLDVRWALGRTDGPERYRSGHLPGAVYVDLEAELAAPPSGAAGRHPLASGVETPAQLRVLRDLGYESVQGYLTGAPAPLIDLRDLIAHRRVELPAT